MGRNIQPTCKQCRREGSKLFLKGDKCDSTKCPMVSRNYPPGVHGPSQGRPRLTVYGAQLRQKQSAKRIYNLMEKQFRNYYEKAYNQKGDTGENLLRLLELRLDNIIYRLGFVKSRRLSRQAVGHGLFMVNGKKVNVPSYKVRVNDVISVNPKYKDNTLFTDLAKRLAKSDLPQWLGTNPDELSGTVLAIPHKDDLNPIFDVKMIVEFYSR